MPAQIETSVSVENVTLRQHISSLPDDVILGVFEQYMKPGPMLPRHFLASTRLIEYFPGRQNTSPSSGSSIPTRQYSNVTVSVWTRRLRRAELRRGRAGQEWIKG
ncbi:hypothetical protein CC1G_11422 [Coprinopsis cinerea okayama7|uniref:Uncharacterized protein n=1 Tax=Coprinopsis cinerea (strain Okayama-7 / 130 / ATCC MYA-4618 / FGSC 9003) TaxID=240176 RepID=A8N491_COPC7|nr:hypothetical protein CC1G_11422 [Coprinopsis cinerea okayama7\|eukprot:XP_001829686.1 hypothetical protein CC1G_11422 [Coprinopsis cinerea okayama7\